MDSFSDLSISVSDYPFHIPDYFSLSNEQRLSITYQRARALGKAFALTADDVVSLSPKFWELHQHPLSCYDSAAYTLLTIQYNLAAGTLAPFALRQRKLHSMLQRILNFDVSAQFLLTEIGHGLDVKNMETTATLLDNGDFDLHTPTSNAAKWMPPTSPVGSLPRIAVVFAKLIVGKENRGVRPFLVALGNGQEMCKGISSRLAPSRGGCKYLDHALTTFNHVQLPRTSLLGELEMPASLRLNFLRSIWRVSVGGLALSLHTIPSLRMSAFVAGRYSMRRLITDENGKPISILAFRTQNQPIVTALANVEVLNAFGKYAISQFSSPSLSYEVRAGIAAVLKAVVTRHGQDIFRALGERCGAQGLFMHNMILEYEIEERGIIIAEGDVLTLCIRLASELLLQRYTLPEPQDPCSLLARHEAGLFQELQTICNRLSDTHRGEAFKNLVLPYCRPLIEAIGYRMAYEAAKEANVSSHLLAVYESTAVGLDESWYVENGLLSRQQQRENIAVAFSRVLPQINHLLDTTGVEPYCTAPIVSQAAWDTFAAGWEVHTGDAVMDIMPPEYPAIL